MQEVLLRGGGLVATAQACVGVVGVSVAGVLWCVQMSELRREDFVQVCVLEHTGYTRWGRSPGDTNGEADGFQCRCGVPGLLRASGGGPMLWKNVGRTLG